MQTQMLPGVALASNRFGMSQNIFYVQRNVDLVPLALMVEQMLMTFCEGQAAGVGRDD